MIYTVIQNCVLGTRVYHIGDNLSIFSLAILDDGKLELDLIEHVDLDLGIVKSKKVYTSIADFKANMKPKESV